MNESSYDWIVVGGGISGLSVAEILSREDKSVLLIEKNELLASETSKQFHEWVHSGALYTLVPDNLFTLRYLLGATDDLLKFYGYLVIPIQVLYLVMLLEVLCQQKF